MQRSFRHPCRAAYASFAALTAGAATRMPMKGESRNGADRWGERHAPARGRARFNRANRVERREFFEVPYMSHRERTAWLRMQSRSDQSQGAKFPASREFSREFYRNLPLKTE
jgi:hypothetical protein